MPGAIADPAPKDKRVTRRLLRSPFVDLLLGPHGIDRYLEQLSPRLTVSDARAEIMDVRRQTARSVTLRLRPNGAWQGARAGQFVRVGIEIDGVRRTRTYSPSCSERAGTRELELTVTEHPGGVVSEHLLRSARPGTIVHLGPAQGEFALPALRPRRLSLISGGSGITSVLAMLRTLCEERHDGELRFVHYARTEADWLYRPEVTALAAAARRRVADYRYTRGRGAAGRLDGTVFGSAELDDSCWAAVCGPASLVDAARTAWAARGGAAAQLLTETFEPATLALSGDGAQCADRGGLLRGGRGHPALHIGARRRRRAPALVDGHQWRPAQLPTPWTRGLTR